MLAQSHAGIKLKSADMVCSTKRHLKVVRDTSGRLLCVVASETRAVVCNEGSLSKKRFGRGVERWDKVTENIPTGTQGLLEQWDSFMSDEFWARDFQQSAIKVARTTLYPGKVNILQAPGPAFGPRDDMQHALWHQVSFQCKQKVINVNRKLFVHRDVHQSIQ